MNIPGTSARGEARFPIIWTGRKSPRSFIEVNAAPNLRNHVHVLRELAQERGEGAWLFEDDELLHPLRRLRWETDATSPGGKKKSNEWSHNYISIVIFHMTEEGKGESEMGGCAFQYLSNSSLKLSADMSRLSGVAPMQMWG